METKFDDDFEITPLAGKTVNYSIEVHEVSPKKAPDPQSEDFLKSMKVENLDSLKEKIREDLKVRKEQENQNSKRQQVTQKILEIPEFALPQQAVEDESKNIFQGNIQRAFAKRCKRG